jgi:hypothetical protein
MSFLTTTPLTMTPCYSILLSLLALVLITILAAPILYFILQRTWRAIDAAYIKITNNKRK